MIFIFICDINITCIQTRIPDGFSVYSIHTYGEYGRREIGVSMKPSGFIIETMKMYPKYLDGMLLHVHL